MVDLRIAATADIHSPKYIKLFSNALRQTGQVDLMLIAGDIVYKNRISEVGTVLSEIRRVYNGKIIACFGNEEYLQSHNEYKAVFKEIVWLDDSREIVAINNKKIAIIGSQGSLDRPTSWQKKNIKNVTSIYERRIKLVNSLLAKLSELSIDYTIVLTHYSPTYKTLVGESRKIWPEMGCSKMEDVINKRQPDYWIHGHAHYGVVTEVRLGNTKVINASLPARKRFVVIELVKERVDGYTLDLFK